MPTYQVILHRDAAKALPTVPAHIRDAVCACVEQVLQVKPLERIPQKTKKLKGRLAGLIVPVNITVVGKLPALLCVWHSSVNRRGQMTGVLCSLLSLSG